MNLIKLARSRIGISRFDIRAGLELAPEIFRCSTYTSWSFRCEWGIELPPYAWQQHQLARKIARNEIRPGDLVFMKGTMCRAGAIVGHVGIVTTPTHFIHASSQINGVGEFPLSHIKPSKLVSFGRVST